MKKFLLVGLFAVAAASAAITPDLTITGSGGVCTDGPGANCTYSYQADLAIGHSIDDGDFFTIYDFAGFVEGSMIGAPGGWVGTASPLGLDPISPAIPHPGDNPNVWNITWMYSGPKVVGTAAVEYTGFTAVSRFHGAAAGRYGSQTYKETGLFPGPSSSAGPVDVPARGPGDDDVVPEPMSMALLGSGLAAIGLLRFRKQS